MSILRFMDIGANGCSASADLIGNNVFSFFFKRFYKIYDRNRKVQRLGSKLAFRHRNIPPLVRVL